MEIEWSDRKKNRRPVSVAHTHIQPKNVHNISKQSVMCIARYIHRVQPNLRIKLKEKRETKLNFRFWNRNCIVFLCFILSIFLCQKIESTLCDVLEK